MSAPKVLKVEARAVHFELTLPENNGDPIGHCWYVPAIQPSFWRPVGRGQRMIFWAPRLPSTLVVGGVCALLVALL
jgi:hypothetical protein